MTGTNNGYRYFIGIEREGLRCDGQGNLCMSRHPQEFGDKMKNRFITTDFGEEQIELRTSPCESPQKCYDKLLIITRTVLDKLFNREEYIWPYSMPCTLPAEQEFRYNDYTGYPDEAKYEKYLAEKYGYQRLCISGVHFNFSVTQTTVEQLRRLYPEIPSSLDEAYMRCIRGIYRAMDVFSYFFNASPSDLNGNLTEAGSFRNSAEGYNNGLLDRIDLHSKANYVESVQNLLDEGLIARMSELYVPVRAREAVHGGLSGIDALRNAPIDHIELRMFDIDPFDLCGISPDSISLATAFVFCCFVLGEAVPAEKEAFIDACFIIDSKLGLELSEAIELARNMLCDGNTLSRKIREQIRNHAFDPAGLAASYSTEAANDRAIVPEFGRLEPSTKMLIQDAILLGIDYRLIDHKRNIVEFIGYKKKEVIVQATRTSRDSYIFEYITDDKLYAREVFAEAGLCVPRTVSVTKEQIKRNPGAVAKLIDGPAAIKPKSANYGDGITLFEDTPERPDVENALKVALEYDDTVLIEEFIPGKEYRFFLIDGKVRSVVNRVPANVTGDGIHSIKELIAMKEATRRFRRWRKTITINDTTDTLLKSYGMDLNSIPEKGDKILLQKASNASLGGETVDVTDEIPDRFKRVAERAAELFHAFICGVDIMIPDISGNQYTLLEINDNPGMFICEVPVVGEERRLGQEILTLLGLGA